MAQLLVRGELPCYDNVAYYVCSKTNFMGCCSVDPCASGICPDHTNITTSMTTAPTRATTKAGVTVTKSAAKITSLISSQSISSAAPTLSSTTTAESSSAAAMASPTDNSSGSSHRGEGALIGGLATGFVALLVISGILSFFIARTRRRRGKRFTLLDWHGPNNQDQDDNGTERVTRRDIGPSVYGNDEGLFNAPTYIAYQPPPPSTRSRSSSPATPKRSKPINTAYSPYSLVLNSVDSVPKSTVPLIPSVSTTSSADSIQLTTSIPPKRTFTPELPDTGFYRQRAELASYSQSELINIPLDQRQRIKPVEQHQKSITTPPRTTSTPPIVTSDGAVLGANLDQITPAYDSIYPEKGGGETLSHVMSFMHYGSGSESGRGDSKESLDVMREVPKRKSIKQKVRSRLM